MNIETFPKELVIHIFSFLPDIESSDIPNFCSVNKKIAEITKEDCCWERFIPKKMISSTMNLKQFVLTHTIGSEKELVKFAKNFISQVKLDQNNVFQCIFKKNIEVYQDVISANPSVKLSLLFNQSNSEVNLHKFVFRNEFTPSCIIEESKKYLVAGEINFSYFPLKSLPPHLETMFKKIQNGIEGFQKKSKDKSLKAEENFLIEKFPSEYKIFAPRLTNSSVEYDELHSLVQLKVLELDKDAQQFPILK